MEPNETRALRAKKQEQSPRVRHGLRVAAVFVGVILLFGLLTLLLPDREYSAQENRMLAQAPAFSLSALADGSYFVKSEDHLADQFAGRDAWMSLNFVRARVFGAKESGGVYLGHGGYLIQAPNEPNREAIARSLQAMESFAARHSDLHCYLTAAPNAFCILEKKLPVGAPVRDQRADLSVMQSTLSSVQFIDVTDALAEHSGEYIYYKTDHHWTSLGAKYAFEAMAPALGITPVEDYDVYTVSTSFEGTLASKSGSHGVRDTITVYAPTYGVEYKVSYRDTQTTVCSVYDAACLEEKDQYTVFLGGNHPRIDVVTTAPGNRNLLLLKDSYANCFVQFLTPYFEKIIVVDPRYYYDSLETLLRAEGITDVLFLYNADTFQTDTALADALESE